MAPCLTDHEIAQLLVGDVAAGNAASHENHLLDCGQCVQTAEQVDAATADDNLVRALAAGPESTPLDDGDQSAIETLIDKLGQLTSDAHAAATAKQELAEILAPPQAEDEIGWLAHFRILEVLGAGGMGIVLKAEDVQLSRIVALKVMRPSLAKGGEAKRRFRREAQAAAAFEHDHIVTIYQVEEDRGVPFLSMQWLEGESLRDRLRREGRLSIGEALRVTREIASGLAAAHRRGLLHRDIKPDNIWLCADTMRVKIVDFGLVRSLEEPSSLTHSGLIVGTPQYMAPEQAQGEPVDVRTDLFSTGCVLYHMLCGRPAFAAGNVVATLVAVSKAEVTPPQQFERTVPRAVSDLTMRLLAREPEERIDSAETLEGAVAALEEKLPRLAVAGRPGGTRRWLWSAVLAASLAAVVLSIIYVRTRHGMLIIEADQQVAVLVEGGAVELHDRETGNRYELRVGENELRPGEYEIIAKEAGSDLEFSARQFTIRRGDERSVVVTLEDRPPPEIVAAADEGTAAPRPEGTPDQPLARREQQASSPDWLNDVQPSLGIAPGEPLSPLALVQEPGKQEGIISWTLESATTRGAVNDAAFSADGRRIATAGQDGTVRIYDAEELYNARERTDRPQQLIVCPGPVRTLAWSPTGKLLATAQGSSTPSICVWRLGEQIQLIAKINRSTSQLAWSPDESLLAFEDSGVQLWSVARREVLPNFGMTGTISDRPWSADGRFLASRSPGDNAIKVWDLQRESLHATIGSSYRTPPIFAYQGSFIAVVEADERVSITGRILRSSLRAIHIWDLDRNQRLKSISLDPEKEFGRYGIAWSPDGSRIAALGDIAAGLWDVETGEELPIAELHAPRVFGEAAQMGGWSADGQKLLLVRYGSALIWDAKLHQWNRMGGNRTPVSTDLQGEYLALHRGAEGSKAGGLRASYERLRSLRQYQVEGKEVEDHPSRIDVWHLPQLTRCLSVEADDIASFRLSPSGKRLALIGPRDALSPSRRETSPESSEQLSLQVYDTTSGTLLCEAEHPAVVRLGVEWSPDEEKLLLKHLSARSSSTFLVVDAKSGILLHTVDGPDLRTSGLSPLLGGVASLDGLLAAPWSPDGDLLAWSTGKVITVAKSKTGEVERRLEMIPQDVREAEEEFEEQRQAARAKGEPFSRTRRLRVTSDDFQIGSLCWSPDGRWIAALRTSGRRSAGSRVLVWDLTRPDGEPRFEQAVSVDANSRHSSLSFSPDGKRLLYSTDRSLWRWETESGALVLDSETEGDVVGWLPDGLHFARILDPAQNQREFPRLVIQQVDGAGGLKEITLHRTTRPTAYVSGDHIYVADGRANLVQCFNSDLAWESTYLIDSDGQQSDLVGVFSDGRLRGQPSSSALMGVILSEEGQRTLSFKKLQAWHESTTVTSGDGENTAISSATATPPEWLGAVAPRLGIEKGEPLSPVALVQQPPPIDGVITWTFDTVGHRRGVNAALFSPDGSRIATAGDDGTIRIIAAAGEGPKVPQVIVCPGPVKALAWSPSGKLLASAQHGPQDSLCVWQLGERVKCVAKIYRAASQLAWSPDGRRVAFSDYGVHLWDVESNEVVPNFGMQGTISHRPWSTGGEFLASLDEDSGSIHIWNYEKHQLHSTIGESYRTAPIFARQGNYLAALHAPPDPVDAEGRRSGRSPAEVQIWDINKNQLVKKIPVGDDYRESIAWSPDGSTVAVMDEGSPTLWDVKTGRQLPLAEFDSRSVVSNATSMQGWSPDSKQLLAVRYGSAVRWGREQNEKSPQTARQVAIVTDRQKDVVGVKAYYLGQLDSKGYPPSNLHLVRLDQSSLVKLPAEDVVGLKLSPDGSRLAVVGPEWNAAEQLPGDQLQLRIYSCPEAKLLAENEYKAAPLFGVVWSPSGDKVLLRRPHNTVLVVDAETGALLHTLEGPPPHRVFSARQWSNRMLEFAGFASWLPNGKEFAWRSSLTIVAIVNGQTGETLRTLEPRAPEEMSAEERRQTVMRQRRSGSQFERDITNAPLLASPDGRWLAAHYTDYRYGAVLGQSILLWDLSKEGSQPAVEIPLEEIQANSSPLFFSPDSSLIATSNGDSVLCWETATGNPVCQRNVEDPWGLVGWTGTAQLALTIRGQGDRPHRLATIDVRSQSLTEAKIYTAAPPVTISGYLRDGHVHIDHGNILHVYGSDMRLLRTMVFTRKESSTDGLDLELTEIAADGSPPRYGTPLAIVLTDEGQETLRYERFIDQYPAAIQSSQ